MTAPLNKARSILGRILNGKSVQQAALELRPCSSKQVPLPPHFRNGADLSDKGIEKRRSLLRSQGISVRELIRSHGSGCSSLAGNIENFVGFAQIPVGVIGPLRINGVNAHGDFYIPLATSEGALVASYHRGACVVSRSGGVSALCLAECVSRSPCFIFDNLADAGQFLAWVVSQFDFLQSVVARTSRHCQLSELKCSLNGKETYLLFEFTTGDASGQNMVTIASEAVCRELIKSSPIKPRHWYIEGNMSGDKKATMLSFTSTRGKDVVAEAIIPARILKHYIHATPQDVVRYWQISLLGGIQSGSIGVQGHFANALAAIFIACGQDVACVSEASVGMTRMDLTANGDLYVSVKLPNLIVGTVGGGTSLQTARECLAMLGCSSDSSQDSSAGTGFSRKFAEVCAATVLAGEISLIGSLASGDFVRAHSNVRAKRTRDSLPRSHGDSHEDKH